MNSVDVHLIGVVTSAITNGAIITVVVTSEPSISIHAKIILISLATFIAMVMSILVSRFRTHTILFRFHIILLIIYILILMILSMVQTHTCLDEEKN